MNECAIVWWVLCVCVCVRILGLSPVWFCSSPRWCWLPWQQHQLWISPSSFPLHHPPVFSSPPSLCFTLRSPSSCRSSSLVSFFLFFFPWLSDTPQYSGHQPSFCMAQLVLVQTCSVLAGRSRVEIVKLLPKWYSSHFYNHKYILIFLY